MKVRSENNYVYNGGSSAGTKPVACFTWSPVLPSIYEPVFFDASCSYDPGFMSKNFEMKNTQNTNNGASSALLMDFNGSNDPKLKSEVDGVVNTGGGDSGGDGLGMAYVIETQPDEQNNHVVYPGCIVSYEWDFGDGNVSFAKRPVHSYTKEGVYNVTLRVIDNDNESNTTTHSIVVIPSQGPGGNKPPVAVIDFITPNPAERGMRVSFKGHGIDPDDYITAYQWISSWDGLISTQPSFDTSALSAGVHIITFKVKDKEQWSSAVEKKLIINIPPVAQIEGASLIMAGREICFDGARSFDPDGTIISYEWSFGDGENKRGVTSFHVYINPGMYIVSLKVTDSLGGVGVATTRVKVVAGVPYADADGPYIGHINQVIIFNGSKSMDPDGVIKEWYWDFGDGNNSTGMVASHVYKHKGVYRVTLTVLDDDGASDTDITNVTIIENNPPSKPVLKGVKTGKTNVEYWYSALSIDSEGDMKSYVFNWGDNTSFASLLFPNGTLVSASHSWDKPGKYIVRVSAIDEYNACSEYAEMTVVIECASVYSAVSTSGFILPSENHVIILIVLSLIILSIIMIVMRLRRVRSGFTRE
ncbi:MAG: PKD domain-containing protein [Candidatus Thermoplasmatota archaeon]